MQCIICSTKVTEENDGLALTQTLLSFEENQRFNLLKKSLCIECKREMLFANIIRVV